jgi:hypothetical protein
MNRFFFFFVHHRRSTDGEYSEWTIRQQAERQKAARGEVINPGMEIDMRQLGGAETGMIRLRDCDAGQVITSVVLKGGSVNAMVYEMMWLKERDSVHFDFIKGTSTSVGFYFYFYCF